MVKHCKVSSSTKWRLRENVVLRLMECLTPSVSFDIFMDNYFTFFRLLTHLGVNNIWATRVLNKNRLRIKCTINGRAGKIKFSGAQKSKQVQESVVRHVILCTLWLFEVHVFASSCTTSCAKWNMLWKDEAIQNIL